LQPFSFVFLLSADNSYHIVLETLDTEEATYIWHTEKNNDDLKRSIKSIDNQLLIIKEKGRQVFLDSNPEGFSKIIHDYFDNSSGLTIWKGLLEERIF
jgi:hypothetical protein